MCVRWKGKFEEFNLGRKKPSQSMGPSGYRIWCRVLAESGSWSGSGSSYWPGSCFGAFSAPPPLHCKVLSWLLEMMVRCSGSRLGLLLKTSVPNLYHQNVIEINHKLQAGSIRWFILRVDDRWLDLNLLALNEKKYDLLCPWACIRDWNFKSMCIYTRPSRMPASIELSIKLVVCVSIYTRL